MCQIASSVVLPNGLNRLLDQPGLDLWQGACTPYTRSKMASTPRSLNTTGKRAGGRFARIVSHLKIFPPCMLIFQFSRTKFTILNLKIHLNRRILRAMRFPMTAATRGKYEMA